MLSPSRVLAPSRWSAADEALFNAVADNDVQAVHTALAQGGVPHAYAVEAHHGPLWLAALGTEEDDDGYRVNLALLGAVLREGADLTLHAELPNGEVVDALGALFVGQPTNALEAAWLLIQHGARPTLEHILDTTLLAHADTPLARGVPPITLPLWNLFWAHLPLEERQALVQACPLQDFVDATPATCDWPVVDWLIQHGATVESAYDPTFSGRPTQRRLADDLHPQVCARMRQREAQLRAPRMPSSAAPMARRRLGR